MEIGLMFEKKQSWRLIHDGFAMFAKSQGLRYAYFVIHKGFASQVLRKIWRIRHVFANASQVFAPYSRRPC
jgi:hypothetical protein